MQATVAALEQQIRKIRRHLENERAIVPQVLRNVPARDLRRDVVGWVVVEVILLGILACLHTAMSRLPTPGLQVELLLAACKAQDSHLQAIAANLPHRLPNVTAATASEDRQQAAPAAKQPKPSLATTKDAKQPGTCADAYAPPEHACLTARPWPYQAGVGVLEGLRAAMRHVRYEVVEELVACA